MSGRTKGVRRINSEQTSHPKPDPPPVLPGSLTSRRWAADSRSVDVRQEKHDVRNGSSIGVYGPAFCGTSGTCGRRPSRLPYDGGVDGPVSLLRSRDIRSLSVGLE